MGILDCGLPIGDFGLSSGNGLVIQVADLWSEVAEVGEDGVGDSELVTWGDGGGIGDVGSIVRQQVELVEVTDFVQVVHGVVGDVEQVAAGRKLQAVQAILFENGFRQKNGVR